LKRTLIYLGVVIVVAVLLVPGIGFFLSPQNNLELSDAIVIISGGETQQRVSEGVKLYQDGWAPFLIMSGAARDEGTSNALAMKKMALSAGVPDKQIVVEEEATNTFENALKVKNIIQTQKITKMILVTSPYHQRRASQVFHMALRGLPIEIINHSAKDSKWRKNGWWENNWARKITFSELQKILYTAVVGVSQERNSV
jgi:uncharacterized SAM-binding protein YcdF (DUF218 family)